MANDTEYIPRDVMYAIVTNAPPDKRKGKGLSDWIIDSLDRRDLVVGKAADFIEPPDFHLRVLKEVQARIREALNNEVAARDLSSLTRRLQDVSREIVAIEDRVRAENEKRGRRNSDGGDRARPPDATGARAPGHLQL